MSICQDCCEVYFSRGNTIIPRPRVNSTNSLCELCWVEIVRCYLDTGLILDVKLRLIPYWQLPKDVTAEIYIIDFALFGERNQIAVQQMGLLLSSECQFRGAASLGSMVALFMLKPYAKLKYRSIPKISL